MTDDLPERAAEVFTIGHSNHPPETFLDLLRQHAVEVVVDVRSSPYSGYSAHFNKEPLENLLSSAGIKYLFLGDVVGGRPQGDEFYDDEGYVLYDRVAASEQFCQGIERLEKGLCLFRLALLCGEEDPTGCHRRLLVGRVLVARGARVLHVRGDGRLQTEEALAEEERFQKTKGQMSLFEFEDPDEWKSTQSALQRRTPPSSSRSSDGSGSDG
jgi:uncharacterized protein (DUF488 family)